MLTAIRALAPVLLLVSVAAARTGGEHWVADFDVAAKTARTEKKDLLVEFTGSDWCPPCMRLKSEVFDHAQFTDAMSKDFVLVALDYPKKADVIAKVPNPKRNAELQTQFKIQGYPTVLLMTPDGEVYASTGYRSGGPVKYVEHLNQLRQAGRAAIQVVSDFEKAEPAAKDAAWEKVVAVAEAVEEPDPAYARLLPVLRSALTTDADNRKGHKQRAIAALFNLGEADRALIDAAIELDPKNERGLLQRALLAEYRSAPDAESATPILTRVEELEKLGAIKADKSAFELYAMSAMLISQVGGDAAKAKDFAKKAVAIGSKNRQWLSICEQLAK